MAETGTAHASTTRIRPRAVITAIAVLVLLGAIALDTKVVTIGGDGDLRQQAFDPDRFGRDEFPRIRDFVIDQAPDAALLAEELEADKTAATTAYGTMSGAFPVMTVTFTGSVGEGASGIFSVDVPDLPDGLMIRVQTGPAINGTELRDIVGDIDFGDFTNQIEYQNAGAGINRAMAAEILADLDRDALSGKTISVTGAFTLINPNNWLVTPVALEVE